MNEFEIERSEDSEGREKIKVKRLYDMCMEKLLKNIANGHFAHIHLDDRALQCLPYNLKFPQNSPKVFGWSYSGNGNQMDKMLLMMQHYPSYPSHDERPFKFSVKPSSTFQKVKKFKIQRINWLILECGEFTEDGDENFTNFLSTLFQENKEKLGYLVIENSFPSKSVKTALTHLPPSVFDLAIIDSILPPFTENEVEKIRSQVPWFNFRYNEDSYESTLKFLQTLCHGWKTGRETLRVFFHHDKTYELKKFEKVMEAWAESSHEIREFWFGSNLDLSGEHGRIICDYLKNKKHKLGKLYVNDFNSFSKNYISNVEEHCKMQSIEFIVV